MNKEQRLQVRDFLFTTFKDKKIIFITKKYSYIKNYNRLNSFLESNDKIKKLFNDYITNFRTKEESLYCLLHHDDIDYHLCPICNERCKFEPNKKRYSKTCGSNTCKKELTKRTNLKLFGYKTPMESPLIKEKMKNTMIEKYGIDHPSQSKIFEAKRKQTNLERYGYEHPTKSKIVMDKIRRTNLERYGTEYVLQNQDIKYQIEATMLEKYGVVHPLQSSEIKEKMKNTNIEKYGCENPFGNSEIRDKIKKTHLEKYGVENISQINVLNYDIWSNNKLLSDFIINEYERKGYFLTLSDIRSYFNVGIDTMHDRVNQLNLEEYFYIHSSSLEIEFLTFLSSNNINLNKENIHNRHTIKSNSKKGFLELDFTIPNTNIAIEINDIATHNSFNTNAKQYKDPYYHYNKSLKSREAGMRLIHLWEWEIRNKFCWNKISQWLLWLFKNDELKEVKIDCNKVLNVKLIKDYKEEEEFMNLYNIYGYIDSNTCIGLYYGNEIILMISLKELDKINKVYQILRLGFNYNFRFNIELFKILLRFFKLSFNPSKIIAYNHLDKDISYIFKSLSFSLESSEKPKPIYCNKKLDISSIEKYGYIPIYDCGIESYYLSFD